MTPLTDLGSGQYLGFAGGLYPKGKNIRPPAYEKAGVALAATVGPVDEDGNPSTSGKVVMISIGMSNASREFSRFIQLADAEARKNPSLLIVDAALNGADALQIAVPSAPYWGHVDRQLERAEATPAQVQVAWVKMALAYEAPGFPAKAQLLKGALRWTLEILRTKFPQLKLIYISSRTYGGYSKIDLSVEPLSYESAFAVKWLIEERIKNQSRGRSTPWVSWGPYLWADGMNQRSDGLIWELDDYEPDGVHPNTQGSLKAATMLLDFFANDSSAQPWFFSSRVKQLSATS